ncbi:MAG: tail fiber domain-containing protein [Bacteroidota bacterium]
MKKIILAGLTIGFFVSAKAQVTPDYSTQSAPPTNNNPVAPGVSGTNSQTYWSRVGNTLAMGTNNIFGTLYNAPIYHQTLGLHRMTVGHFQFGANLDGNATTPDNPLPGGRLTRIAIHRDGASPIQRPLSLLHLGYDFDLFGSGLAQGGYRNWMDVGTMYMAGTDNMYVGLRQKSNTATGYPSTIIANPNDRQDAVVNWGDNVAGSFGPDNLCFIYTAPPTFGNERASTNDGLEIMRMIHNGNVGLGPVFSDGNQPKSNFHLHNDSTNSMWIQFTNEMLPGAAISNFPGVPGAISSADGFRIGMLGDQQVLENGNSFIYNQENRHLIFSTNANTNNINIAAGTTLERMRITHINAPTNLAGGGYGVWNPGALTNTNLTRVAISHNPTNEVTRPMSLLHLGYNTGQIGGGTVDGWRSWMDIGMFTSNGTDNVYIGLKPEPSSIFNPTDRHDAVLAWGDNQEDTTLFDNGPDRLRFIFTGTQTGSGVFPPANSQDGLECGRFYPDRDTLGTFGRFGVGDFTVTGVNQEPTHKLDVVGNGRFRFLPDSIYMADSLVNKFVMVDSAGVLRWLGADQFSFQIGQACGDSLNLAMLTTDREVPMNDFNIYFTGQGVPTTNSIALGLPCGTPLPAKFNVYQDDSTTVNVNTIAGGFRNQDTAAIANLILRGVFADAIGVQDPALKVTNIGGEFRARNSTINIGVRSRVQNTISNIGASSTAGDFLSDGPSGANQGIISQASNATSQNTAIQGIATSFATPSNQNTAGYFLSSGTTNYSYGVYAEAFGGSIINRAGYFNGDLEYTGALIPSDQNLKTDINNLENSDSILTLLSPKTFEYDVNNYPQMNFAQGEQMGLIAQEVEQVLPNIVKDGYKPAVFDTLGNQIYPAISYKTLNYESFIPLLIAGHKDQANQIKEKDSIINALVEKTNQQDSINNALYAMITQCCQNNSSQQSMMQNGNGTNGGSMNVTNVELSDVKSIILDQNVPNPFAEQTTITFTLTEGVQKAQMLFYNLEGKLINSVDLSNAAGKGQLNVFANDLSNGIYTYTLVVDGQIIDTKRMVKDK